MSGNMVISENIYEGLIEYYSKKQVGQKPTGQVVSVKLEEETFHQKPTPDGRHWQVQDNICRPPKCYFGICMYDQ